MATVAEKLAKNISLGDFKKASSLKKKLLFTFFVLVIYRVGSFIPLPGVDASALKELFGQGGGILDIFNSFTGGALSRMTVFALNIIPYISASIITQMLSFVTPSLIALRKEGPSGQQKINQYTRYLTIVICIVQGYGMAVGLMATEGAVVNPGTYFIFSTIVTLLAGSMLVMWMGEQITVKGIGQGSSVIIFAGIITVLPSQFIQTMELAKVGQIQPLMMMFLFALLIGLFYVTVFVEMAQRRLSVHYPKRASTGMGASESTTHLPLKLNVAGVLPPIFAVSLLGIPTLVTTFMSQGGGSSSEFLQILNTYLRHGSPLNMAIYAGLIIFFSFLFTSMHFNPDETAENLKENGAFIPGVRPGEATAKYLDFILTRLTVFGSVYLIAICLIPDYVVTKFSFSFFLGGTSLLIICHVIMEIISQVHSHLISHQYEAIMKQQGKQKRRFK